MGVSLRNLVVVCFQTNLASIRSFKGCNVAWFTVLETKDIRLKIFVTHPIFVMISSPKTQLIQLMHSGSKRLLELHLCNDDSSQAKRTFEIAVTSSFLLSQHFVA